MTMKSATTLRNAVARMIGAARPASAKGAQRALSAAAKAVEEAGGSADSIRAEAIRQIAVKATANDSGRPEFAHALETAGIFGAAFAQDCAGGLRPSPALVAFLRRAGRRFGRGSASGHADFGMALPAIRDEGGAFQIIDLTTAQADNWADRIFGALSHRPDDGLTAVFVSAESAGEDFIALLRGRLGSAYGIESVASIASAPASGSESGAGLLGLFIGQKRFRPIDSLPRSAEDMASVDAASDFSDLEAAMAAARAKIAEFDRKERLEAGDAEPADALRQRPYKPLSAVSSPFTMVPKALEGSIGKAMERVSEFFEGDGGIDSAVAAALDCTREELGEMLIAEQVDAVGMQINAASRERGFLLADQTGVGKGRSLAAMARAHLRGGADRKVLYFTESATVNVPDVCRDLDALGIWDHDSTLFLTTGSRAEIGGVEKKSPIAARQAEILGSGEWPEGIRMIVTTYSKFSGKADKAGSGWIGEAVDGDTMIIMDEAHNALNPSSNMGRNIRRAMKKVPASNVIYASGTPARDPRGLDLYNPLLPNVPDETLTEIASGISTGGTVAQEVFASMLAEDGVMLRRDHDLGNIEFLVDLPDGSRMERYQNIMDLISPVVVSMLSAAVSVEEMVKERRELVAQRILEDRHGAGNIPANGTEESREATREANALEKCGTPVGGPLANFTRVCMNAMKIDQVVDAAKAEWAQGRKPLITFHSTNGSLLQEIADSGASQESLSIKEQVRRIHERIYRVTRNGMSEDARKFSTRIAESSENAIALIETLPDSLSVSPLDALLARLREEGFKVGEISGRALCYRDGAIVKRTRAERDRRSMINSFNDGGLDVLVYNSAGATGASYHASPDFKDQRGRSLIELETPLDIIKYVQSQGRGNRYGQVENPKVISIMTGLTPEMRILQQRNGKLRSLGASVDGNRAHPLLLDDLPDLLNRVGDEAAQNVLIQNPALARRLGFPEIAELEANAVANMAGGERPTIRKAKDSLANKVLTRSIVLPAAEQDDMIQRIRMEFDVLIEELDSRNENPLRPKELDGSVDIQATDLFSGQERGVASDSSSFLSPLYMSTATHHMTKGAVGAEDLVDMVEKCASLIGRDGFGPQGERLRQNIPSLLRPHLPEGYDMDAALENPREIPGLFSMRHETLRKLAGVLERMRPGTLVRCSSPHDPDGMRDHVVVGMTPPANPLHEGIPSAYKVKLMVPGSCRPETASLAWLTRPGAEPRFFPGLSDGMDQEYLKDFDRMASLRRRLPVQVLSGNMLRAIGVAHENGLGSVSLYRNMKGEVSRGIVVHPSKVDLAQLPVPLPTGRVAAELIKRHVKEGCGYTILWGMLGHGGEKKKGLSDFAKADFKIDCGSSDATVTIKPMTSRTLPFYAARPEIYRELFGRDFPLTRKGQFAEIIAAREEGDSFKRYDLGTGKERKALIGLLESFGGIPLRTHCDKRPMVNDLLANMDSGEGKKELPIAA